MSAIAAKAAAGYNSAIPRVGGGRLIPFELLVNGRSHTVDADPQTPLLWVIRDHVGLTGTKFSCGIGQCGACTLHVDGRPIRSCSAPAAMAIGKPVVTIEGVSGVMNLVMVPMWIFSGIFFSTERFPAGMQPFIQALPLTALNNALRSVMLEGSGLVPLLPELALLAAWGFVSFLVALKIFRWQ